MHRPDAISIPANQLNNNERSLSYLTRHERCKQLSIRYPHLRPRNYFNVQIKTIRVEYLMSSHIYEKNHFATNV